MTRGATRTNRLDDTHSPVAIVHEGFFVYANAAFLSQLGFKSLDALTEVPLLDMVENHDDLRQHLDAAKRAVGTDKSPPEARLVFIRNDQLPLPVNCRSFRTRYAGEDCVQLNLLRRADAGLTQRILDLPWKLYLSIAFLILFTILPSTLLLKLNINNVPKIYFPSDEPAVILDEELRRYFPSDQVFLLMFQGIALYSDGFFAAYSELGETLRAHPLIAQVDDLTTMDHIAGSENEFTVEKLVDPAKLRESNPYERQTRVTTDPFARRALAAPEGNAVAMIVIPKDIGNSLDRLALEDEIRVAVDNVGLSGHLKAVAGQIPVDVAELRSMLRDNEVFIPATVFVGLFLVWWLFRRWLAVLSAGVAIGVVVNSTVAIYVLTDQSFTLISSIIPPLLSALTVAAVVHLFNGIFHASQKGLRGRERVERALQEVQRPARFAALTTASGLASLALSPIVPITVFGLISACGVGLIYVVVYHMLPQLFVRWDDRAWPKSTTGTKLVDVTVRVMHRTGMRHPGLVVTATLLGLALGIPQILKVEVETDVQKFFPADHEIRVQTTLVEDNLIGTMPLEVFFATDRRDGLKDPQVMRSIEVFQAWAEQLPQIDRAFSFVDFVKQMHFAFNARNPAFNAVPEDERLVSQYLLIYDGDDIYDFVDREFQHAHVILNLNVHSANEIEHIITAIRAQLTENFAHPDTHWDLAGAGRMFSDMEELLVAGQVYSLLGALILIFVLLLILWRSVAAAALCMIPNLSPVFLMFVVMGAAGIWLDVATAMIASVAVGIAVDDTIHVYHGFRHRLQDGTSAVLALMRTYREAGRAVVVTTVILSAQFLILVWSDFVPTKNFGLLTTIGLVAALLFDLLLLPALLMLIYGPRSPIARWLARRSMQDAQQVTGEQDSGFDAAYWNPERRLALVRDIFSGNRTTAAAAREFGLSEDEIGQWLRIAETGIAEAFSGDRKPSGNDPDPAKVRALAKAYKRLKAENRALKAQQE